VSLSRERPSLASSAWKKLCRRTPAFASLVLRGLYCRQLENIRSTSSMYWPAGRGEARVRTLQYTSPPPPRVPYNRPPPPLPGAGLTGGLVFTVVDLLPDGAEGDRPLDDLIVVWDLQTTRVFIPMR